MRITLSIICALTLIISFSNVSRSETTTVDKEFQGIWIPSNQKFCASTVRIEIHKNTVVLHSKNDSVNFGNLDICYSCAGGAQYSGIEVYLFPEKEITPSPFIIRFNADERKGILVIEVQDEKLKKRFPFDKYIFKRCKA